MKKILKHSALLLSALALIACGAQKKSKRQWYSFKL